MHVEHDTDTRAHGKGTLLHHAIFWLIAVIPALFLGGALAFQTIMGVLSFLTTGSVK